MHNRYPLDAMDITKKEKRGKVFNPAEEAKKCLYLDENGKPYQPSDHLEGALIKSGSQITIAGRGKKSYKDEMKTNVAVLPNKIPMPEKYEVDVRLAVIPATRGRVPVARPMWNKWELDFTIRVFNEEYLDGETLRKVLEIAGREQGIGTYRPKFGRFEVVKFAPIKK